MDKRRHTNRQMSKQRKGCFVKRVTIVSVWVGNSNDTSSLVRIPWADPYILAKLGRFYRKWAHFWKGFFSVFLFLKPFESQTFIFFKSPQSPRSILAKSISIFFPVLKCFDSGKKCQRTTDFFLSFLRYFFRLRLLLTRLQRNIQANIANLFTVLNYTFVQ